MQLVAVHSRRGFQPKPCHPSITMASSSSDSDSEHWTPWCSAKNRYKAANISTGLLRRCSSTRAKMSVLNSRQPCELRAVGCAAVLHEFGMRAYAQAVLH